MAGSGGAGVLCHCCRMLAGDATCSPASAGALPLQDGVPHREKMRSMAASLTRVQWSWSCAQRSKKSAIRSALAEPWYGSMWNPVCVLWGGRGDREEKHAIGERQSLIHSSGR